MAEGRCKPKPGDLIEIKRQRFHHWALYVGNGYVIHVTGRGTTFVLGSSSSVATKMAKVKKELLEKVVKSDEWRVNNKYDCFHTPRPVEEIVQSAEEWIDREMVYDVLAHKCEHFVTDLRYGEGVSEQAEKAVARLFSVGSSLVRIAGAVCIAAVVLSKFVSWR